MNSTGVIYYVGQKIKKKKHNVYVNFTILS